MLEPHILKAYLDQQRRLRENPTSGLASAKFAPLIAQIMKEYDLREVLYYGTGKGCLSTRLGELLNLSPIVNHYDPSIPKWAPPPEPCEFVACIDVLERIEPDLLDNVLDDLIRVTQPIALFTVHSGPAVEVLDDGRNAHLIQKPYNWWLPKLIERFELLFFGIIPDGFFVVVTRKRRC